jgi:hypothetical protein
MRETFNAETLRRGDGGVCGFGMVTIIKICWLDPI